MRSTRTLISVFALASLSVLGGCIPQSKYDDLMTAYRSKEQQVLTLQGDLDSSRSNEEALRAQLAQAAADLDNAKRLVGASGGNIDELERRYQELLAQVNKFDKPLLGEQVTSALTQLAAQYPDIFEFDAKHGMIRFRSDVTFDSGSAKLSAKAQEVLGKMAPILNSGDASNLEVKVVGHTDSQPIHSAGTAALHPTNVHLSAHRAIAVREALVRDGVVAGRFQVAGYGEFRPIVTNGPKGARENRRVEIFLTPMTMNLADLPRGGDSAPAAPARTARPNPVQPRASVPEEPTK
ncbi:MAG: OmpA family protein [Phycisphaerae bacterium]|nr:OmpA family protein [Phycisphaerae bacterium]